MNAQLTSAWGYGRALAEEDASGGAGPLAGLLAGAVGEIYEAGAARAVGAGSLETYLTRRAGMYPDVVERLVAAHLAKGDEMSALITGEWCARLSPDCVNYFFPS